MHRRGLIPVRHYRKLDWLASLAAPLAALLAAGVMVAAAVLSAVVARLLDLSAGALRGFAAHLAAIAQVVVILDHVRTALAYRLVSITFHTRLLSPRLARHWRNDGEETVSAQCQRVAQRSTYYSSTKKRAAR
jgi:hypothetical protein